jgi:pyruvate/2-oxoglutarate dehydrogenase complex dihydrolipoamide acyltransferase (E2) component
MAGLRTEYDFVLPKGLVDEDGTVHREGTMRLATARDELEPLSDPKVKDADDPYLTIIVIARVVTGLGTRTRLSPKDVEGLFAADLAYLQDFYSIINFGSDDEIAALTASVDSARGARRYAPTAADVPASGRSDAAEPAAPAAPAPAPAEAPAAARRPAAAAKRAPAVDEDDLTPRYDENGMELPTPSRRARIEEVGKSNDRPKGAR